jgi:hypothetical protein
MIGYSTINTTTLSISVMLPFLSLARANPQESYQISVSLLG